MVQETSIDHEYRAAECTRCQGHMIHVADLDGVVVKCFACGYEPRSTPLPADRSRRGPSHAGTRI